MTAVAKRRDGKRALPLRGFPDGMPHLWSSRQWRQACYYFRSFYGRRGIHARFFRSQPGITMVEIQAAVLADFDEHGHEGWEFASDARERVRDRILIARGREPIDGQHAAATA